MIGSLNLPLNKSGAKTFVFTANDETALTGTFNNGAHIWQKPAGISFVYCLLISAGSGGGGGGTGGGGGGGSPSGYMQFLQPAMLVPDILTVTVGRGGTGGAAGSNGGLPTTGTSLFHPIVNSKYSLGSAQTYYAYSNAGHTGTQSGRAGTAGAGGAGGTAVAAAVSSFHPGIYGTATTVQSTGAWTYTNSALAISPGVGYSGGFTTAGTSAPFLGRPQGGAGGGGRSGGAKSGGTAVPPDRGPFEFIGKSIGGDPGGFPGEDGITLFSPTLFFTPGAGGGANDAGTGGAGGKGGIGCGGGGGGAGSTVGGRGGDGGDGLVIFVCW